MYSKLFSWCMLNFAALLGIASGRAPVPQCTAKAVVSDSRSAQNVPTSTLYYWGCASKNDLSYYKALRSEEDQKWFRALMPTQTLASDLQHLSPWACPPPRYANHSNDAVFYGVLANEDLSVVREEERIVFETTFPMSLMDEIGKLEDRDVMQDFAVLVPSTNFPPALDYLKSGASFFESGAEIIDVESMYEYFIRVPFANGTAVDISAGLTSFQPSYDAVDTHVKLSSEAIELKLHRDIRHPEEDIQTTNYTAQISDVSGLVFTPGGSNPKVTIVIARIGPARAFTVPLRVKSCVRPTISSKWATDYRVEEVDQRSNHRVEYVLRSTPEDIEKRRGNAGRLCYFLRGAEVIMPNSTWEEIQTQAIVTTRSEPITIPIEVDRLQITPFETYYQTFASSLLISLVIPLPHGQDFDSDSYDKPRHSVPDISSPPVFEDDEGEWVPWDQRGIALPAGGAMPSWESSCASRDLDNMDMIGQVIMSGEMNCTPLLLEHYLDEGARGPVFVDHGVLDKVLAEDPAERALRAPVLKPTISSPPKGEELVHRYYGYTYPFNRLIYVGETWAKKVASKEEPISSFDGRVAV